jgi:hypothetical protein
VSAAPVPKVVKKVDGADVLSGTWKPNGKGTCWFQFNADGTLKTWHDRNGTTDSHLEWTWSVDPEQTTPRRVKLTRMSDRRTVYDCLYERDGDNLKFAFVVEGQVASAKLEAGSGMELHELTRGISAK